MSEHCVPFRPGLVVWLTGLPSSGKSTLALRVGEKLRASGSALVILDEDAVHAALRPEPGCDEAGRDAFYETLARLAALIATQGVIVLVPATAHRRAFRERARSLVDCFLEVYLDTPLEECRRRDSKARVERARTGGNLTTAGVRDAYEAPDKPDLVIGAEDHEASAKLTAYILHQLPRL